MNLLVLAEAAPTLLERITAINKAINNFVWTNMGLVLLIGAGVTLTIATKFFQISHLKEWWMNTIGGMFSRKSSVRKNKEHGSVSQFQALCTALAATIGTGNIAGVASAICVGGPGAVFWMWLAAFFGMMTNYSENILGIYYRRKNAEGEWSGGAMYYLRDGLGGYKGCKYIGRVLAALFSVFAVLASFGIGNMGQINKIVINLDNAILKNVDLGYAFGEVKWTSLILGIVLMILAGLIILGGLKRIASFAEKVVPFMAIAYVLGCLIIIFAHITEIGSYFAAIFKFAFGEVKWTSLILGIVLMILAGLIILGGLKRIASFAEKVVPFMAIAYVLGCLIIIFAHITEIGSYFAAIFKFAFGVKAVVGGAAGVAIKTVITQGCKRGVFSNEAGLGSSVMVHSASNVREPVKQGMWGIFEVFADTMVVCTMTALVVLSSGKIDLETGLTAEGTNDATLVADAFSNVFGSFGGIFVAIAILLFAFTTVVGWSHYGSKSFEYLFGVKAAKGYRVFFVLMIISGAVMTSSLAWDISDTFNGLMMVPNLIGVISLLPVVVKLTKNYVDRRIRHLDVAPMLSYNRKIEKAHAEDIKNGIEDSAE